MRVRRARGIRRRRPVRIRTGAPRPRIQLPTGVLLLLACVPGLAAVVVLVLCANGVERRAEARSADRLAARPAALHHAAKPRIVPRRVWASGTGEANTAAVTPPPARYDDKVVAVFIHHTDSPNTYDCADAPRIIRYLAAGQTGARDWDDIGYNFLVDRCGTIYEGRAGGVDRPVTGAHTQGFNHRTSGIAALGTFTAGVQVPQAMTDAIASLAAWKLGLADVDPRRTVKLTSSNGLSRYAAGTTAALPAIAGHEDGYMTSCPGAALSARLPEIRQTAARLQGRQPPSTSPRSGLPTTGDRVAFPRRGLLTTGGRIPPPQSRP
ncbi:peptidoglycan recognition protein [Streptomyces sp. NPDC021056]|uniref:peptidoglycan recognition protein family protein n=1 Tax=unclassified Streptomyces TaxID=2593676 RepID=UPI0033C35300